jgi:hypothetical protein
MAPTNAQLLAQAKAQLAKTKAKLAAAEKTQTELAPADADPRVALAKLTSGRTLSNAEKVQVGLMPDPNAQTADDTWATAKVGTTGKTQAQLDAAAGAIDVAKSTGGTVDPKTGYVIPPKKITPDDTPDNPADPDAKLLTKAEWDAIQAKTAEEARLLNEKRDAFALIQTTMQGYGFTIDEWNELSKYIEGALINPKIGPNQMILELRALPVYKARFAGNETRVKNGINALSEANYIQQENSYAEYLRAGGVSNLGNRATYAKLIGGAVSPTEVGKRVNMAVDRVTTADPEIMRMIRTYNPTISQQDLVSYFLDPDNTLPELEKKVAMGEIGAAAFQQGLDYGFGRIEDLQKYGVSREQAIAGYGNVGQVLPTATKLGDIYSESGVKYDQTTGESEFFKSDAKAMEKRRQLQSMERAAFSGSSGTGQSSLTRSTQGRL